MSGGVPYLPHGALFSWVVSSFKAASPVAVLNISRGSLYKPRPVWPADLAVMRRINELHLEFLSLLEFPQA
jgi:hypothetical protein